MTLHWPMGGNLKHKLPHRHFIWHEGIWCMSWWLDLPWYVSHQRSCTVIHILIIWNQYVPALKDSLHVLISTRNYGYYHFYFTLQQLVWVIIMDLAKWFQWGRVQQYHSYCSYMHEKRWKANIYTKLFFFLALFSLCFYFFFLLSPQHD